MSVAHEILQLLSVCCLVIYFVSSLPQQRPANAVSSDMAVPSSRTSQNASRSRASGQGVSICSLNPMKKPRRSNLISMADLKPLSGCIDQNVLDTGDEIVMAIYFRLQLRKSDRLTATVQSDLNIKIDIIPPAEGLPRRFTLILCASKSAKWSLNLHNLLAISPHGNHRIVLTNRSSVFSEQMHVDKNLAVQYMNVSEKINNWQQLLEAAKNASFDNIGFVASYESNLISTHTITIQLPKRSTNSKRNTSGDPFCRDATTSQLTNFIDVFMEADDSYTTTCRSHKWEIDLTTPTHVLQVVELTSSFDRPGYVPYLFKLITPRKISSSSRMAIAFFSKTNHTLYLDCQAVLQEIEVVTNRRNIKFARNAKVKISYMKPGVNDLPTFHAALTSVFGPLSKWSVERISIPIDEMPDNSLISIRLQDAPIFLGELKQWMSVIAFDTRDLEVNVWSRPFESMGLNNFQVMLNGNSNCSLYKDGRKWVYKLVISRNNQDKKNGNNQCAIIETDIGNQFLIIAWLSLVTSKKLEPYRLSFEEVGSSSPHSDLPPQNKQNNANFLWSVYNESSESYQCLSNNNETIQTGPSIYKNSFKLELFTDEFFNKQLGYHSDPVAKGDRLYGRVRPSDLAVKSGLMIRDCMLGSQNFVQMENRQFFLHHGCEMGAYFKWIQADSYRIKTFSFELPRPSFFSKDIFYLHCLIIPCNYHEKKGNLPKCWNQHYQCYFPPIKRIAPIRLSAGPFPHKSLVQSLRSGSEIPLWGTLTIATIALLLGMGVAGLLCLVHHCTGRRRNPSVVRQPVQHNAACDHSCVLLRMNPRRLEQERRHLLPNGGFPLAIGTPSGM